MLLSGCLCSGVSITTCTANPGTFSMFGDMRSLRTQGFTSISGATGFSAVALIVFGLLYIWLALRVPYGHYDAIQMWNLRGRLIAFNPDPTVGIWPPAHYAHSEYPPLLPLVLGSLWRVFGDTVYVPIVVHGLVFLGVLWCFRRHWWAMFFIGVVTLPFAAHQNADLPLGLLLLIACRSWKHDNLVTMGLALGLGMLTKNEGVLIAVCVLVIWFVTERRIDWRLLMTLVMCVFLLIAFKSQVTTSNDILSASGAFSRLFDWQRWVLIGLATLTLLLTWGIFAFPMLGIALWFTDTRINLSPQLLAVLLIWCGYIGIYAITPHDLGWHLATSYNRLIIQVFPTLVYCLTN